MEIASLEDLVPRNHLVRKLDEAIDMSFIYEEVKDLYSDFGRESIDPVVLIKIAMIQYIFGIPSMRKTIREIEVNFAYRWYLGYGMHEKIPHFSTFGKNYSRRFKDTDLFEKIFSKILSEVAANGFLDTESLFIDGTHIKASANSHKYQNEVIRKEARSYEKELQEEIKRDRQEHGKKPLKEKEKEPEMITQKISTTDPDSGWFHKGEHKQVFAYAANTCCDKNNYVLDFEVTAGNVHDSVSFWHLYRRLRQNWKYGIYYVMDAGYKIPSIARQLIKDGKTPVMPYKRPMTQAGFFKKYDFVYDEFFDCYLCPDHKVLHYTTTNREGYREYKSDWLICQSCPHRDRCTNSKDSVKVITRHVWENYMEQGEETQTFPRLLANGRTSPYNETIGFKRRPARPCSPLGRRHSPTGTKKGSSPAPPGVRLAVPHLPGTAGPARRTASAALPAFRFPGHLGKGRSRCYTGGWWCPCRRLSPSTAFPQTAGYAPRKSG